MQIYALHRYCVYRAPTPLRARSLSVSPVFGTDGRSIFAFVLMNIHLSREIVGRRRAAAGRDHTYIRRPHALGVGVGGPKETG